MRCWRRPASTRDSSPSPAYRYGKSDIYFVCRLSALSTEITMQEEEIAECLWMPVDRFLSDESGIHIFNKSIVRAALESPGVSPAPMTGYEDAARFEFFMPALTEPYPQVPRF